MACSLAPAGMGQTFDVQFSPMRPIRLTLIMYFIILGIYKLSCTQYWSEVESTLIQCYYVESALIQSRLSVIFDGVSKLPTLSLCRQTLSTFI